MSHIAFPPGAVHDLAPMAPVRNIAASVDFYARLGFEPRNVMRGDDGVAYWAALCTPGGAELMLSLESTDGPGERSVIFYLYVDEGLTVLRDRLIQASVEVGEITFPPYMPEGEICLTDPDGYRVLVGQSESPRLHRRRRESR